MYVCTHFKARRSGEKWVTGLKKGGSRLTILKTEISNLCVFDFLSRQEPKGYDDGKSRGDYIYRTLLAYQRD
jgi:hypothetical protein